MKQFLIQPVDDYHVGAMIVDDSLEQLAFFSRNDPKFVDNLYCGRVISVNPQHNSCFVDIGFEEPALLQQKKRKLAIHEGERVWVRLTRLPFGGKGARVVLARDGAKTAKKAVEIKTPGLVERALDPVQSLLAGVIEKNSGLDVYCDLSPYGREVESLLKDRARLHFIRKEEQFTEIYPLREALLDLLERSVVLDDGIELIFDLLEAVVFIDINAGAARLEPEEVNRRAVPEILRQIRLRHLAGLIAIDFLDAGSNGSAKKLIDDMKNAAQIDRVHMDVLGFTRGGLFEILRQRTYPPLYETLLAKQLTG